MPIPAESDETTKPTPYPNCGSSESSERFGEIRRLLLSKLAGIEDADATADLTASWVISGPTASKVNDVRETIQEGTERGVSLEIPVVEGNSYGALRRIIDRHPERKGFAALDTDERRKLVRLATATLGEEPGRCSPYALAEALLSLGRARSPMQLLRPGDLAAALVRLPAERLVPSLPPTMQKALKALLVADSLSADVGLSHNFSINVGMKGGNGPPLLRKISAIPEEESAVMPMGTTTEP